MNARGRQRKAKCGAGTWPVLDPDLATVGKHDALSDRQAEPDTLVAGTTGYLVKYVEDALGLWRGDAGAPVDDFDEDRLVQRGYRDVDRRMRRSVPNRILNQIRERKLDEDAVESDKGQIRG